MLCQKLTQQHTSGLLQRANSGAKKFRLRSRGHTYN
jgi:hypothetical protein